LWPMMTLKWMVTLKWRINLSFWILILTDCCIQQASPKQNQEVKLQSTPCIPLLQKPPLLVLVRLHLNKLCYTIKGWFLLILDPWSLNFSFRPNQIVIAP
jgi:hypothetical protein